MVFMGKNMVFMRETMVFMRETMVFMGKTMVFIGKTMVFMGKTMVSGRFSQPIHSAKVLPQRPPGRTRPSGRWHGATGRPPFFWMVGRSCIYTVYV